MINSLGLPTCTKWTLVEPRVNGYELRRWWQHPMSMNVQAQLAHLREKLGMYLTKRYQVYVTKKPSKRLMIITVCKMLWISTIAIGSTVGRHALRRHRAILDSGKLVYSLQLMRSPMVTERNRYTVGGTHRWQSNWLLHFVWGEILADWNVHDDQDEATADTWRTCNANTMTRWVGGSERPQKPKRRRDLLQKNRRRELLHNNIRNPLSLSIHAMNRRIWNQSHK